MEELNNFGDYIIKDNGKLIGKNCLTFIHYTELSRVGHKFYNKYIQSPSVRGKNWSHIADWLYNSDKQLMNSISNSLDTDLLQLEITFNISQNVLNGFLLMAYIECINNHLNFLIELLPPYLSYYNLINKQKEIYLY